MKATAGPNPKRYVIHPGPVRSRKDGDIHHVSFFELVRLYGVPRAECVNAGAAGYPYGSDGYPDLVHLWPDASGQYKSPVKAKPAPVKAKPVTKISEPEQGAFYRFMEKRREETGRGNAVLREAAIAEALEDGKPDHVLIALVRFYDIR